MDSIKQKKPEQCSSPKNWAWKVGDIGYIHSQLFSCWIKLTVIKTLSHDYIIFKDDGGVEYISTAWTDKIYPITQ